MRAVFLFVFAAALATPACRTEPASVSPPASASPPASPPASPASPPPPAPPPASSTSPPAPPSPQNDFCAAGLTPLDDETCTLLPPLADGRPPRLLVYLHGIVPPGGDTAIRDNVQRVVVAAATRAGAAVLFPRGMRGIGPAHARDWYAWPTSPTDHAKHARDVVARWSAAKRALEQRAGVTFMRTYLAGSSNGAYFLAALALRSDLDAFGFPVDGLGAMSGGSSGGAQVPPAGPRPPFYVGYGAHDEGTKRNVRSLVVALERARWPSRVAEHPFGHGAREAYLDEAFLFWDAR